VAQGEGPEFKPRYRKKKKKRKEKKRKRNALSLGPAYRRTWVAAVSPASQMEPVTPFLTLLSQCNWSHRPQSLGLRVPADAQSPPRRRRNRLRDIRGLRARGRRSNRLETLTLTRPLGRARRAWIAALRPPWRARGGRLARGRSHAQRARTEKSPGATKRSGLGWGQAASTGPVIGPAVGYCGQIPGGAPWT
jgi:hypothetical protein